MLEVSACNALASIEEGTLIADGQGGNTPDAAVDAEASTDAQRARTSAEAGGSGTDTGLAPDLIIDPTPLAFSGRTVSHSGGLLAGELMTIHSPMGVKIMPDCDADSTCFSGQIGNEVCVSGSTERIPSADFDNYWGAQLHIRVADSQVVPERPPWDRAGGRARGLSFRLTGSVMGNLSFDVGAPASPEENYYAKYAVNVPASSGAQHAILFDTLVNPLWNPALATALPNDVPLLDISWTVGASDSRALTFDFCVSDIRLILAAE
jgi:hypothetical protein